MKPERIVGMSDHGLPRNFLSKGLTATRAVGRIATLGKQLSFCTAFLVAPEVLMTCNHVIPNPNTATKCRFDLDFYELDDGTVSTPLSVALDPAKLFLTNKDLDITLVALQSDPKLRDRQFLSFPAGGVTLIGESVNIIHYPGGEPLRITVHDSLTDSVDRFFHYRGDASPGSSGSPVFNDQWELVGVYHASVPRRDSKGRILAADGSIWKLGEGPFDVVAKEGVRITSILSWLNSIRIERLGDVNLPGVNTQPAAKSKKSRGLKDGAVIPSANDPIHRDSVFISYAHEDQIHKKWKDRLLAQLRAIPSIGEFRVWDDSRIRPGNDWLKEIEYALRRTRVAVLMIGPHFLASEFIKSKELPSIIAASEKEGVRFLPIVTHYAAYNQSELGRFQAINDPEAPLESLPLAEQNRMLLKLAQAVAESFCQPGAKATVK